MKENNKLLLIFLTACILSRLLIAYIVFKSHSIYLGVLLLIIGLLFTYQFYNNKEIGSFGQKVWWNNLRILHSILYIIAGILVIKKDKNAYKIIILDTFIGLSAVLYKRVVKYN